MVKYFKSSHFLATYNLKDHQIEKYSQEKDQGKEWVFVIDCSEEEYSIWKDVQEVPYQEIDKNSAAEFILNSEQMKSYKPRLIKRIKNITKNKIETVYPLYKQININSLQGYTENDKQQMWDYINEQRNWSNSFEDRINSSMSIKELENIESEIRSYETQ